MRQRSYAWMILTHTCTSSRLVVFSISTPCSSAYVFLTLARVVSVWGLKWSYRMTFLTGSHCFTPLQQVVGDEVSIRRYIPWHTGMRPIGYAHRKSTVSVGIVNMSKLSSETIVTTLVKQGLVYSCIWRVCARLAPWHVTWEVDFETRVAWKQKKLTRKTLSILGY